MARKYWLPDFKTMYPEADNKVIKELKTSERRMIYQEHDLKVDRRVKRKDGSVEYIPSLEDSYERLVERNVPFMEMDAGPEEQLLHELQLELLQEALAQLTDAEKELIDLLFYRKMTEREVAALYDLSQNAVNKRRRKVLSKLRMLMENF